LMSGEFVVKSKLNVRRENCRRGMFWKTINIV
jgi:hypothetical protein